MKSQTSTLRCLIVNADDFGLSPGVNRGIIRAHERGVVTSASLMVRQPAAGEAAQYARRRPQLSVGLHLDLGEWVYRDGNWSTLYEVVPPGDARAVAREVSAQVEAFVRLVGRPPTHIDSHQHAHRSEPLLSAAREVADRFGAPLRHFTPLVRYCGDFYGQTGKGEPVLEATSTEALVRVVRSLPEGVTELACHPGDDPELESVYRNERLREVETLCDPAVPAALAESRVRLISFLELLESEQGKAPSR